MVSRRNLDQSLAAEKVAIVFYQIIEGEGKRMLKPLKLDTKVSLKLVRAIAADTVVRRSMRRLRKPCASAG